MATSRVKTNLFLTFEIAAKWQNVCYTQQSYRLISLNQPKIKVHTSAHFASDSGFLSHGICTQIGLLAILSKLGLLAAAV